MKRHLLPALLLLAPTIALAWPSLTTNFLGIPLDGLTFGAPGNNQSPVFDSATKKWKVAAAVANDSRLPTPAITGAVLVDAGTGGPYGETAQGAVNTLLHGTGNSTPTFTKLVDADVTAATITAGSLASSVTNRLMLTPATIGRIEVDGGAGNPPVALAQGAAGTLLISQGAAANPAFTALSGDVTITSGGVVTIGGAKVSLAKIANAAANSVLVGSGAAGIGASYVEIALGTNLSMSGTTLNASGGSTIGVQSGGSDVTGSPAAKMNFNNGLQAGTVSGGISAVQPTYGTGSNTVEQGNDTRNNAAPSAAGKLSVDTGSAWHSITAGAANTLLHGAGAADPTYSALVDADITAGTITAGSLATAVTNRLMLTPSTVGAIEVDGGTGAVPVRLAQGAAGTILISQGAAANPAFTAMSTDATIASNGALTISALAINTGKLAANAVTSGKVDSTVTISSGANAKNGDQAYGNHGITNFAALGLTDQVGSPTSGNMQRTGDHIEFHDATRAVRVPKVLFTSSADIGTVANQTSLTSFGAITTLVAADLLAASSIEVIADGMQTLASNASQTIDFDMQIGGTTVISWAGGFITSGRDGAISNQPWSIRGNIFCRTAGLSGTVLSRGTVQGGGMSSVAAGAYNGNAAGTFFFVAGPSSATTLPGTGALTIRYRNSVSDGTASCTLNNVRIVRY